MTEPLQSRARTFIRIALAFALGLTVMLLLAPREEIGSALVGFVVLVAAIGLLSLKRTRAFVRHRAMAVRLVGAVVVVGGVAVLARAFVPPLTGSSVWIDGGLYLLILGAALIWAPFAIRRLDRDMAAAPPPAVVQRARTTFSLRETLGASAHDVFAHPGSLLRVVGPWIGLGLAPPVLIAAASAGTKLAVLSREAAIGILAGVAAVVLVAAAFLLVGLIQWARFTTTRTPPPLWPPPIRALGGVTWRLLVGAGFITTAAKLGASAAGLIPSGGPLLKELTYSLGVLAGALLFSPFALALPAAALRLSDRSVGAAYRSVGLAGPGFFAGFALLLGPPILLAAILRLSAAAPGWLAAALLLLKLVTVLIALLIATGFLTRVRLRAEDTGGPAVGADPA